MASNKILKLCKEIKEKHVQKIMKHCIEREILTPLSEETVIKYMIDLEGKQIKDDVWKIYKRWFFKSFKDIGLKVHYVLIKNLVNMSDKEAVEIMEKIEKEKQV